MNNHEAGNLRHHRCHYDVIVMIVDVSEISRASCILNIGQMHKRPQSWRKHDIYELRVTKGDVF